MTNFGYVQSATRAGARADTATVWLAVGPPDCLAALLHLCAETKRLDSRLEAVGVVVPHEMPQQLAKRLCAQDRSRFGPIAFGALSR